MESKVFIIAGALLFFTNILFALPRTKKFVKCEYKYIKKIDSLIFNNYRCVNETADVLDILKKNSKCYRLKKNDMLLLKTFINRTQLIVNYRDMIYGDSSGNSYESRRAQLDLYRDYVTASAEIQARFERKYQRIKKRKCK